VSDARLASQAAAEQLLATLEAQIARGDDGSPLGSGYQAVLRLHRTPLGAVVIKRPRPSRILGAFNRAALRRELAIYGHLGGVPGIPRVLGSLTSDALVLEHVEGCSLREAADALQDRERFFTGLRETLDAMHAAGVAHGDLKRKENILVGPGERAYVIDFGAAWYCHPAAPIWRRWIFEWLAQTDDNAWIKLKYRRRFDAIGDADRAYYRPQWLERMARWIRVPYQTITLRRWRKRRNSRRQTRD
jgi:serine/threonine protein kinase